MNTAQTGTGDGTIARDRGDTRVARRLQGGMGDRARVLSASSELSEVDLELIRRLQHDGRIPYSHLAEAVGVNEHNVSSRVNALREADLIEITIVADPGALGYRRGAIIGIRCGIRETQAVFLNQLASIQFVAHVVSTTGRYQYLAECFFMEMGDLRRIAGDIANVLGPNACLEVFPNIAIPFQEVSFDEAYIKDRTDDALVDRSDGVESQGRSSLSLTDSDHRILQALSEDGRRSYRAIARELGVSEAQVRQRFARLRDAGIARVQAIVDPRTLGFETVAWLGINAGPGATSTQLGKRLAEVPGVTYVSVCLGRYDLFVEVIARDELDLQQIIDSRIKVLDAVGGLESFLYVGLAYKPVEPLPL